jgi:hypothetical protein
MVAGLLELRLIDSRSEAMRIATWHLIVMATTWVCFLLALVRRPPSLINSTSIEFSQRAWRFKRGDRQDADAAYG